MTKMFEIEIEGVLKYDVSLSPLTPGIGNEQERLQFKRLPAFSVKCMDMDTGRETHVFMHETFRNLKNVNNDHVVSLLLNHFEEKMRTWRTVTSVPRPQLERVVHPEELGRRRADVMHYVPFCRDALASLFPERPRPPTIKGAGVTQAGSALETTTSFQLVMDLPGNCRVVIANVAQSEKPTEVPFLHGRVVIPSTGAQPQAVLLSCMVSGMDLKKLCDSGELDSAVLALQTRALVSRAFPFLQGPSIMGLFDFTGQTW